NVAGRSPPPIPRRYCIGPPKRGGPVYLVPPRTGSVDPLAALHPGQSRSCHQLSWPGLHQERTYHRHMTVVVVRAASLQCSVDGPLPRSGAELDSTPSACPDCDGVPSLRGILEPPRHIVPEVGRYRSERLRLVKPDDLCRRRNWNHEIVIHSDDHAGYTG